MGRQISIIIILIFSALFAYPKYEYSRKCQDAMLAIYDLKLTTAREILKKEKKENPENNYVLYFEHYCDVLELIVLEDESKYDQFKEDYYERREILDEEDASSPYHKLVESEMLFHLGLAQLKFGSKIKGGAKVYSSYNTLKDNLEEFPDFWLNKKMAGIFNMIFANIPPSIRWATNMLGLRGDLEKGFQQIVEYQEESEAVPGYAQEGITFRYFSYKFKWDEVAGFEFLSGIDSAFYESTLISYFYANIASMSGQNDIALEMLESIYDDPVELDFYGMFYLTGRCTLNKLEKDADIYFFKYLDGFPGVDYKKDVCNRLSWFYLVNGSRDKFEEYREKVGEVGDDLRDRDREAVLESKVDYHLNVYLLKARLLFDGGYYDFASQNLDSIKAIDLNYLPYRLEYHYRKGRIKQRTAETTEAIAELQKTIEIGKDENYTFATRAALQLGLIYEEQGNYEKAREYFDLCEELYDSDHTVDGVENRAEMGIKRIKKAH